MDDDEVHEVDAALAKASSILLAYLEDQHRSIPSVPPGHKLMDVLAEIEVARASWTSKTPRTMTRTRPRERPASPVLAYAPGRQPGANHMEKFTYRRHPDVRCMLCAGSVDDFCITIIGKPSRRRWSWQTRSTIASGGAKPVP